MVAEWNRSQRLLAGLITAQAADAAFNVVALYPVAKSTGWGDWAKQWARDDLDRLGFPERFRFVFPIIKTSSVAGLVLGFRWRQLGKFTAAALVAYFVAALGFHVRADDDPRKYVPAVVMLVWSYVTVRSLRSDTI